MRRVNLLKRTCMLAAFMVLAGIGWIMADSVPATTTIIKVGGEGATDTRGDTEDYSIPFATLNAAITAANQVTTDKVEIAVAPGEYTAGDTFGSFGELAKKEVAIYNSGDKEAKLTGTLTFKKEVEKVVVNGFHFVNNAKSSLYKEKNSISVFCNNVEIVNNAFTEGTVTGNAIPNGVVFYPQGTGSVTPVYSIHGNDFSFKTKDASCILFRENFTSTTQIPDETTATATISEEWVNAGNDRTIIANNKFNTADTESAVSEVNAYVRIAGVYSNEDAAKNEKAAGLVQRCNFVYAENLYAFTEALTSMNAKGTLLLGNGAYGKEQTAFGSVAAEGVTIDAADAANADVTLNGTLAVEAEKVTIQNLKFVYVGKSSAYSDKIGISVFADAATIKGNTFTTASTSERGTNGVVFYPKKSESNAVTVAYVVEGNTFDLQKAGSTAIIVRENFQSKTQIDGKGQTAASLSNGPVLDAAIIAANNKFSDDFAGEYYARVTGNYSALDANGSGEAAITQKYLYKWTTKGNLKESVAYANESATIKADALTMDDAMAEMNNTEGEAITSLTTGVKILCKDAELYTSTQTNTDATKMIAYMTKVSEQDTYVLNFPAAATYYVAANGTGNGLSEAKPLAGKYLQAAINAASKDVKLAAGTYTGNFVMKAGVNVTGADKATTILNGGAKGRVVSYKADAKYDKTASNKEKIFTSGSNAVVWSNLGITGGKIEGDGGAGAMITDGVTLLNCDIYNNQAVEAEADANTVESSSPKGGGVMCYLGGTVDNCRIYGNLAHDGGAGVVLNIYGTIKNSDIYENKAVIEAKAASVSDPHSGGINTRTNPAQASGEMLIENCIVRNNTAKNIAGVSLNGNVKMVNTLVYGNVSTGTSGQADINHAEGAVTFGTTGSTMLNCTVWNNTNENGGVDAEANVTVRGNDGARTITNSIMQTIADATNGTITYSASTTEITGETNKTLAGSPFEADSYELAAKIGEVANPCINGGSNDAYGTDTYPKIDLAGKTRVQEKTIDLGAYESVYVADKPVNTGDALKKELEENKPAEIVIEAPTEGEGNAELTIKDAIEVDYPVTIKSSDDKPVTIKVEEGKSAFTTKAGGELTLDNVTIATTEAGSTGGTAAPVINIEKGSEATLQNSTLAVPATVTAIKAEGKMTISDVKLTVSPVEGGTAAPVINVVSGGDVTIDNAAITNGTIEVTGTLTIEPAEKKEVVFTQTSEDKPALDLKGGANVTVTNAQFTGKAVEAASGAIINFSNCNFSSPKDSKAVRMTRSTGGDATVVDAGEATATIEGCIFTGIEGENPMLSGKNLTVKSCLFYDNDDMVMIDIAAGGTSVIANNTCVNNNEEAESAVITIASDPSSLTIKNNILWTNAAEAILYNNNSGSVTISHNALKTADAVEANSLKLAKYSYIKFNNTEHPYMLDAESPVAKHYGDATGIDDDAKDILGNLRLTDDKTNKTVHLGAYESVYTPTTGGGSTGGGTGDTTPDATGIKLDKTTLTLARLQSYTLVATVEPAAAGGVKWTSTDPSVATVDANGKVTAVKVGQATIIATAINGGLTALCQVTVDFATGVEEALAESAIIGREGGIQIQPATPVEMIIVNMAGTVVAHRTISQAETISVPKGIYIVRLSRGGHVLTQKVNVR